MKGVGREDLSVCCRRWLYRFGISWSFLFLAGVSQTSWALSGVVVAEEAQIYSAPDFDSDVIGVAPPGTKLTISKGVRGDFAKFRKTKWNGKVGWISSIDVKTEEEVRRLKKKAKVDTRPQKGPFADEARREREEAARVDEGEKDPFIFRRSVGLAFGIIEYRESLNGLDRSENLFSYGLKLAGPDVFFDGPIMDVNILFHYGAPDYYGRLSVMKPTGFLSWVDAGLLFPFLMKSDSFAGLTLGPAMVVSNIETSDVNQTYSMWSINAGLTLGASAGASWGGVSLRADGKYWFERQTYRQLQLSVQSFF